MKNTKYNIIKYDLNSKIDSLSIIDISVKLKYSSKILRVVSVIDRIKSKNRTDLPLETFNKQTATFVSQIDQLSIKSTSNIGGHIVLNLFTVCDSILKNHGYQEVLNYLKKIEPEIIVSTDFVKKSMFYQVAMTYHSYSNWKEALRYENLAFNKRKTTPKKLGITIKSFDAKDFILKNYENKKVILINEAHSSPQNRAFIRDLLPDLSKKGFNVLALEALNLEDSLINKRKYPLLSSSTYFTDPIYNQAIRLAKKHNYFILPYDYSLPNIKKLDLSGHDIRELSAFENIKQILKTFPSSKIIIWSGHDHIFKINPPNRKNLGEYLTQILDSNLVSIDCTTMREHFDSTKQNAYYSSATNTFKNKQSPYVLLDSSMAFIDPSLKGKIDLNVFLPPTIEKNGLPQWYFEGGITNKTINIDFKENDLIQIYYASEYEEHKLSSIPIVQFFSKLTGTKLNFPLQMGNYIIKIVNKITYIKIE
ncbi:MAG: hypothetical protein ACRCVT_15700 [Leadbetterella sp.]